MPFFSRVFRRDGQGASAKSKKNAGQDFGGAIAPPQPRWEDAWSRKEVSPDEIQELIHECTQEMKSRALDMPFLLLPFRPGSDASSSRLFIGKFFKAKYEGNSYFSGLGLQQELRLTEPMVLCSIMKWCWSRLPGGVVTWDVYEMFKIGEQDAHLARHSFNTFVPLSVESPARKQIIFDFFDLLAAIAARGKTNGLGGRKLSRMAGWWAFETSDQGTGFEGGYKSWQSAADAASHLFFAYLRSLSPDSATGVRGISQLPRSLQSLLSQTEYPPERPMLMHTATPKVMMIVNSVSPTPFALLRRAKHFEYHDDDLVLQAYSSYEDPVKALTDECRRVLNAVSQTNQSDLLTNGAARQVQNPTWSRFEDFGFSGISDTASAHDAYSGTQSVPSSPFSGGIRKHGHSRTTDFGRPTTPSWADFLSSGFANDGSNSASTPMLLPPDKVLPPIGESRGHSSQSYVRSPNGDANLDPGELASVANVDLDDTFWWVWMTSLASEEPAERKAVFGRCALIETNISGGRWLVMEEQVKGASPDQEEGAYIVEKKSRFSFSRRNRMNRRKSEKKKSSQKKDLLNRSAAGTPQSRVAIGADQHAKIQAAAAELLDQQRPREETRAPNRTADGMESKTTSILTLQPQIMSEAAPAMKWARDFDRSVIRARYLGDPDAGKGRSMDYLVPNQSNAAFSNGSVTPVARSPSNQELPKLPQDGSGMVTPRGPSKTALEPPLLSAPSDHDQLADMPSPVGDEKPLPPGHPALRDDGPSERPTTPEEARVKTSSSSPESAKGGKRSPKKLKKQSGGGGGGGGGFMKLFGKKNKENRQSRAFTQPLKQQQRADTPEQLESTAPSDLPSAAPTPEPYAPTPEPYSPMPADDATETDISRVPTHDEREAATEFNRFDQGPLEDVPAFVPHEDIPTPSDPAPAPPDFGARSQARKPLRPPPPGPAVPSPALSMVGSEPATASDAATEENLSPPVSATDRWAQIRKNAAERAQRYSEDQSGPSHRSQSQSISKNTDDGDTSGEETIESRVARIKARVAELTGNMEQQPGRR